MRVFKVRAFSRCAHDEQIDDEALLKAVNEIRNGLVDAKLGGGVIKKRVAAASHGKRGGARVIVAFQSDRHIFFMYMFLKKEQDNIDKKELKALKQYAQYLLNLDDLHISAMIKSKDLFEIKSDGTG